MKSGLSWTQSYSPTMHSLCISQSDIYIYINVKQISSPFHDSSVFLEGNQTSFCGQQALRFFIHLQFPISSSWKLCSTFAPNLTMTFPTESYRWMNTSYHSGFSTVASSSKRPEQTFLPKIAPRPQSRSRGTYFSLFKAPQLYEGNCILKNQFPCYHVFPHENMSSTWADFVFQFTTLPQAPGSVFSI